MSNHLLLTTAALGCGVVSGVFFTFSGFVMPALGRLPVSHGAAAMQAINIAAVRPPLMIALFGTAALCVAIAADGARTWGEPGSALRVLAALLYLAGVIGVTLAFNVPRNNALANLQPDSAQAASAWATYLREWTAWNSVRAIASGAATLALLISR